MIATPDGGAPVAQEPAPDLDDAETQEKILDPPRARMPVKIEGDVRFFTLPTEPSLAQRKVVFRHIGPFVRLFNQELANRVGAGRMTMEFLTDSTHIEYIKSAMHEPAVRDKSTLIASMMATYDPAVEVGPLGPNFEQLDREGALEDETVVAIGYLLLAIWNAEMSRQKNGVTGAASA